MTVIAAVNLSTVVIGVDRRFTSGSTITQTDQKIAVRGAAVIAVSGWAVYATRWLPEAPEYDPKSEPTLTAFGYACRVADSLTGWGEARGATSPEPGGRLVGSDCWVMVATEGALHSIAPDGSVSPCSDRATDGSGEAWAGGYLDGVVKGGDTLTDEVSWVRGAIECASRHDSGCGDGWVIYRICPEDGVKMVGRRVA